MEDITFNKTDFTKNPLTKGDYECCTFINCDFSNSDLSGSSFVECEFKGCNLSLVKLINTTFADVKFKDCKMLGLHFEACNEFGLSLSLDNCSLNLSSFYKVKLIKTTFKNSHFQEADFTESDLTNSVFDNCDFSGATFENTIIENADLRTSVNYSIDPERNKIKKAKFSLTGSVGLLDKYNIEIDFAN
jgi:uncharacterized protein YjbI with pentapeptide repeats